MLCCLFSIMDGSWNYVVMLFCSKEAAKCNGDALMKILERKEFYVCDVFFCFYFLLQKMRINR